MTPPAEALFEAALRLPESDRAELAERLLESLDGAVHQDPDVRAAWAEEIAHRLEDISSGRVQCVPWEEVRRRMVADSDAQKTS
jgi:putative addiction module component (TIGR02574 family)